MALKRAASGVTIRRLKRLESARARSLRLPLLALQLRTMCGRITQKSNTQILGLGIVTLVEARLEDASPLVRAMAVWALSRLAPDRFNALRAQGAADVDAAVRGEWLREAA
jgi:epoxyqueuosine reductase